MTPDEYWFPWFPARFRRKTMHLTPAQRGIYRDLIDYYMETREKLPDNDIALARIVGVTIDEFKQHSDLIKSFFVSDGGFLYHDFCNEQLDAQEGKAKKRSKIAKNASKSRWSKDTDIKDKNASSMHRASSKHPSSMHEGMLRDATGQDRTREDKTGDINNNLSTEPATLDLQPPKKSADEYPVGEVDPENKMGYEFNGKVIRLTTEDFNNWLKMTGWMREGLWEELDSRDEWYAQQDESVQKKWFFSTSKYLQKVSNST